MITADGHENFTDSLPSELNELEKLVGQGGIGVQRQPAADQALRRP